MKQRFLILFLFLVLLSCYIFAQQHPFKFAWLSDTHVGGSTGADDLRKSVRDINAMEDISFTILSGDITEMGSNDQLGLAKQILDSLNKPYYIIPGNHDTKWSESAATMFVRLWGRERFVLDVEGIRFIGLHQGPRMRMGDGHWAPEDLRWVDSVLAFAKQQPLIIITHYPVDPSIDNWFELLNRVKKFNVQAILCGHGHANRSMIFEGVPGVMGRSNLRARDSIGGFNIVLAKNDTLSFAERVTDCYTKKPWQFLPILKRSFAKDTTTYQRPDFSVNKTYKSTKSQWIYKTGWTVAAAAAITSKNVLVGDASGTLTCLSLANGKPVWKFKTTGPIYSTPTVTQKDVFIGSGDGNIYCVDLTKGTLRWKTPTDGPVLGTPLIEGERVYIGASDRKIRALDIKDGRVIWSYDSLQGFVEAKPLLYQNKVIVGAWDSHLYALDASNGRIVWLWTSPRPGILLSPAACDPVASNGVIYIVAPDRAMTAIDAATGETLWRTTNHQVRETMGMSKTGDKIFVRTMNDSILAFAAGTRTYAPPIWGIKAGFEYDINSAQIVEKEGVIYYGTKNGLIYAIDSAIGTILWTHRAGVCLVNTLAPVDRRSVVSTDFDGVIQLIVEKKK